MESYTVRGMIRWDRRLIPMSAALLVLGCSPSMPSHERLTTAVDAFVRDFVAAKGDAFRDQHCDGGPIAVCIAIDGISCEDLSAQWAASRLPVIVVPSLPTTEQPAGLRVSLDTILKSDSDTVSLAGSWRDQQCGLGCSVIELRTVEFSGSNVAISNRGVINVLW